MIMKWLPLPPRTSTEKEDYRFLIDPEAKKDHSIGPAVEHLKARLGVLLLH